MRTCVSPQWIAVVLISWLYSWQETGSAAETTITRMVGVGLNCAGSCNWKQNQSTFDQRAIATSKQSRSQSCFINLSNQTRTRTFDFFHLESWFVLVFVILFVQFVIAIDLWHWSLLIPKKLGQIWFLIRLVRQKWPKVRLWHTYLKCFTLNLTNKMISFFTKSIKI